MPAQSLEQILKIEAAIQSAWLQILQAGGIPNDQLFIEFVKTSEKTPRVEINLVQTAATGHYSQILPGIVTYSAWEGQLVSRVCTRRNLNGDQHDDLLAICRREAAHFLNRFTRSVLPFHSMTQMRETGTHRAPDPERDEDATELIHKVVFCVRQDAWPATES